MPSHSQQDTVADLAARLDRLRAEAGALDAVSLAERNAVPPAGGWSIAQVVEHLAVTNALYLPLIAGLIEKGRAMPRVAGTTTWKPRLIAGLLWKSLAKEGNRFPAQPAIKPGPTPEPGVLARYQAGLDECAALLPQAAELPWNRLVGRSPLAGFVRPNLGDAFMTVVVHSERHHRQVARVRAALGARR